MRWFMALRAGWRTVAADTLTSVVFFTIVAMTIELFLSGMTLAQSLQTRLTATPINLLTGRPYGKFRDWMFRITGAQRSGQIKRAVVDIVSFILFQMTLYAEILKMSGATLQQIVVACGSATVVSLLIGRPYGLCQDFVRRMFGVKPKL